VVGLRLAKLLDRRRATARPLLRAAATSIGMSPTNNAADGAQPVDSSVVSTCCASGLRAPATSGPTMALKYCASSSASRILRENDVGLFVQTAIGTPSAANSAMVTSTSSSSREPAQQISS
jgi:hypothetical protein